MAFNWWNNTTVVIQNQLQDDPEFQLLLEVDRVLQGSKIWAGMEWAYHPIHPVKYTALIEKVRQRLDTIYEKHGVKQHGI